ncbi:hypothetical protein [uncultured Friedmanniella sp.]|uniref:hypothetical protein n=1 Tax=uncultured Friedmanniella sp. TaxID=335381 RepID=UPI0035CB583A
MPADGPVSWTAREDAAEAAAVILGSEGGYDGPVTLTAGAAPTFSDLARTASELTGRPVTCAVVDPQEWSAAQTAAGRPAFLAFYEAAQQGFFAEVDPLLETLLGHAPRTAREALAAGG